MAPPDSQESRRRPAMLMAAVAGLVSVTAIACLVFVWPSAEPAAPAELLVMPLPLLISLVALLSSFPISMNATSPLYCHVLVLTLSSLVSLCSLSAPSLSLGLLIHVFP
jgi:hypothetical protein